MDAFSRSTICKLNCFNTQRDFPLDKKNETTILRTHFNDEINSSFYLTLASFVFFFKILINLISMFAFTVLRILSIYSPQEKNTSKQ